MFREGEKHGSGSLLTPEGDTLEGEWLKSRPQEGNVSVSFWVHLYWLILGEDAVCLVPVRRVLRASCVFSTKTLQETSGRHFSRARAS